jgi:hypothetical protein
MEAQGWLDKAKERATKAAWKLNRLRADDPHVKAELIEAADQLQTAYNHCQDAARKLKIDLL